MTKTVLITGTSRGIGLEFARQYSEAGWRVFAACRRPQAAHDLNALAAASGGSMTVHPLDVTDPSQLQALQQAIGATPLDLLLNNAGIYGQASAVFGHTDAGKWLEAFRVNTIAPMKIMEAFVSNVAASDTRLMAALSSKMGSMADNHSGGSYVYRSSKAALNAVMKSAAVDLRDRGVTVVALHPGWVRTDMGGASAEISTAESVAHLRRILDRVTAADSGSFFDVDGSIVPW